MNKINNLNKEYKELIYFKKPSKIEMKNENEIILFSKNGTTILSLLYHKD